MPQDDSATEDEIRPLAPRTMSSKPRVHPLAKPTLMQRQSSTFKYNTFPAAPPRNLGNKASKDDMKKTVSAVPPPSPPPEQSSDNSENHEHHETPLPKGQLAILAVIALAEQTALNSISPYLPEMASTFPEVQDGQVGLYVGLIASSFALAQFATNFGWGLLSDRIGRKPIVLLGTFLTAVCFVLFGMSRTLWQAVVVQVLMGSVNGNQGVISTCLGEITDRSNQSRAFTYLPVIYGLGGITGPLAGGLLVFKKIPFTNRDNPYPYLPPNLFAAAVLMIDLVLTMFFLEESLDEAKDMPPLGKRVGTLFTWIWQFTSSRRPTYLRRNRNLKSTEQHQYGAISQNGDGATEDDSDDSVGSAPTLFSSPKNDHSRLKMSEVLNRDTILLLITFLIFQLANISFNSLYPIFAQAQPPTGRDLNPEEIGFSLAFAGVITILFQIGIFGRLREKAGNKATYRAGLAGFVVAFLLIPFVGYKNGSDRHNTSPTTTTGKVWLWIELGAVLIIKTVAAVGGLTSALLLITNSAPSHAVLGTLNGLAQTLSAGGRAVGPFLSGALFTAATKVEGKGELVAFGVFAGVAFVGFGLSFGIRGQGLEAEGFDESQAAAGGEGSGGENGDGGENAAGSGERRG
jgi:MFS family permease